MTEKSPLLLRAQGLGKSYPLDDSPAGGLIKALFRPRNPSAYVEVLKGVDLEVRRGESLAIIGRNGAGKSTLLSILGGVTDATSGNLERFGRVATILGIGERLDENLTGLQNAELFCQTSGVTGQERTAAIRRIEAFADLGDYFRRPLRTYSSGMRGRLGFSCAANVEADLIIVDEVLSVGDADFRQKCLLFIEKQQRSGITYVIVSHSVGLIANLCSRAIVLDSGQKLFDGPAPEAVSFYQRMLREPELRKSLGDSNERSRASQAALELVGLRHEEPEPDGDGRHHLVLTIRANASVAKPDIRIAITDQKGIGLAGFRTKLSGPELPDLEPGFELTLRVGYHNRLTPGRYYYRVGLASQSPEGETQLHHYSVAGSFDVGGSPGIGLVDLGMQALGFEIQESGENNVPKSPTIGFFLHLPGDMDALGGLLECAADAADLGAVALVHEALLQSSSRVRAWLSAIKIPTIVAPAMASPAEWLAAAGPAKAWLFGSETSLRPHKTAFDLALAAKAAGARTFSVQHGFENVGLSFFDDVHGHDVRFASDRVLAWSPASWFPSEIPAENRAKIVPVGRAHRRKITLDGLDAWPLGDWRPDVAIFENIHWHRYSEAYRAQFLDNLAALCAARPETTVLVRPHPQGRWLTERFKGSRPHAPNLILADPTGSQWTDVEAHQIVRRAGLVLTTPSTVALDAAEAGVPVAILAYDLDAPLYRPLAEVRNLADMLNLVDDPTARRLAREAAESFVEAVLVPGQAAERGLDVIREAMRPHNADGHAAGTRTYLEDVN